MNLSGLGSMYGGFLEGQAAQQENALRQAKLDEEQRRQRAMALMLQGLGKNGPQAQPRGPVYGGGGQPSAAPIAVAPPTQPQQQMAASLLTGTGGASMPGPPPPPAPSGGGGPMPMSGGGGSPPGAPGPGPGGQPPGAGPQPGGGLIEQLVGMKQRIMQANPGADPKDVAEAIMLASDIYQKDQSFETKGTIAMLQMQGKFDLGLQRLEALDRTLAARASEGAANREVKVYLGDRASDDRRRGQDLAMERTGERIEAQKQLQQSAQAFRAAQADLSRNAAAGKGVQNVQMRGALAKWQGAMRKLNTLIANTPGDKAGIAAAQKEVEAAETEYNGLTTRETLGADEKKPAAPVTNTTTSTPVGGKGGVVAPITPAPAAAAAAVPPVPPALADKAPRWSPSTKSWWWQENGEWKTQKAE